jgi:hypothetical protein
MSAALLNQMAFLDDPGESSWGQSMDIVHHAALLEGK